MSFISTGFLAAGLAALAVPVVLHLLFRRRSRLVNLGTLKFLQIALKDQAHRRKLRRWLLLALRMLATVLLAALFARPYFRAAGEAGDDRQLVILIDHSASMSARAGTTTRFALAQEAAAEALRSATEGTAVHVTYFDTDVALQAKPEVDPQHKPTARGTDYAAVLKWTRDLLARGRRTSRRVVLITDLQKSGQRPGSASELPANVSVEIVDVGRAVSRNVAVTAVETAGIDLRDGQPINVMAELRNTGSFPARDVNVSVILDLSPPFPPGAKTSFNLSKSITIPAGAIESVTFELPIDAPGLYSGRVQIDGEDELPFDNLRHLAFEARRVDKVLLVDGEPGATVYAGETYYIEMALQLRTPGDAARPATPFEVESVPFNGTLPDLNGRAVVVLANVQGVDQSDVQPLDAWVKAGGQLILFGGKLVEPEAYLPLFDAGLLPAKVIGTTEAGAYRMQAWESQHPLLAGLSDPQYGDLRSLLFRQILELKPSATAKVLARDGLDRPLIVEQTLGKGRVLQFAMGIDRDWGDWPTEELFVPVVHQTFRYLTGRLASTGRVQSVDGAETAGIEHSREPSGKTVVRNPDPRESETARLTEAAFRKTYRLADRPSGDTADKLAAGVRPGGAERSQELWEYLLWGLLVVLIVETFLANRTHA